MLHSDVSHVHHHHRLRYDYYDDNENDDVDGSDESSKYRYLNNSVSTKVRLLSNAENNTLLEEGEIKQAISLFQEYYQI